METQPQWKINYTLAKAAFQQADMVYSSRTGEEGSIGKQYEGCGFEKSALYYKQALSDLTGFDEERQFDRVFFYKNAAQAFSCAGEFDMALDCLEAMKRQYGDDNAYLKKSDYYSMQGFVYLRKGVYPQSVDSYTKSLERYSVLGRDTAYRLNNKALALMGLERYDEAFDCLKLAVKMTGAKVNIWDAYTQCAQHLNKEKDVLRGRKKIEQLKA